MGDDVLALYPAADLVVQNTSSIRLGHVAGCTIPEAKLPIASPWSALVLGECYAQARGRTSLRRMPLAAALSCLSFSVARLTYLWSSASRFGELIARVIEHHRRLLPKRRTFGPGTLLPIWSSLWALQGVEPYATQEDGSNFRIVAVLRAVASGCPIGLAMQQNMSPRVPPEVLRIFTPNMSTEDKVRNFDLLVGGLFGAIGI